MANDHYIIKKLKHQNYELYKYFDKGLEIVSKLNKKSYEAYIVGGAVRDILLNKDFNDIDIATNATPEAIKKLFPDNKIDYEYEHLGSVVLYIDQYSFEITTFRSEEYVKHRIKNVHYSKKLIDDIVRRDYTINALAFPLNLELIDLIKGKKDLDKKIIRIIGKGKNRFKDDPTRILRGFHLVSKLDFKIESRTLKAMVKSRNLLSELSNYKITILMKKILNEEHSIKALKIMKNVKIFKSMPEYDAWIQILIKNNKLNYIEKFTILYKLLGDIPTNNGFNHAENLEIKKNFQMIDFVLNNIITGLDIIQLGVENLIQADMLAKIVKKDYLSQQKQIKKIQKKLPIHSTRELKISVEEIKIIIEDHPLKITDVINELLVLVVNGTINNRYSDLENAIKVMLEGKDTIVGDLSSVNFYTEPIEENKRILDLLESVIDNKGKVGIVEDSTPEENEYLVDDTLSSSVVDVEPLEEGSDFANLNNMEEIEYEETQEIYQDKDFNCNDDLDDNKKLEDVENTEDTESFEDVENTEDIDRLLKMYNNDFSELYRIHRKSFLDEVEVSNLNEELIAKYEARIKAEVKQMLIQNNENYKKLNDMGEI